MTPQERIIRRVVRCNWMLFAALVVGAFFLTERRFFWGVLSGGILVTANFHMLARTLKRAFTPPHVASHRSIIAKYYLRFVLSGVVIMVLIGGKWVAPLGLILGLSIVVMGLFVATIMEVVNFFSKKEAS